jgi:K+/H+ antiporter YhaU regulatory subunit KhtT
MVGQTLGEAAFRARTGANVVAIKRKNELVVNPSTQTVFLPGDRIGLLGNPEQIEAVERLLAAHQQA